MQNFDFYNPTKMIFGDDTIKQIGEEIKLCGVKKVMLVAGKGSIKDNGVYHTVVQSLKEAEVDFEEAWGIRPNPSLDRVQEIINEVMKNKCEALLAVGGGSVIDSCKSIAAGVMVSDVWSLFEKKAPIFKALPIFTVLTISAAGSEMNGFAVLSNDEENKKWAIGGPGLYPKVSIVDPGVQLSLPWNQTVNGAIDAMSHIQEFYFLDPALETSLALNESLMKTVIQTTDRLKAQPKNINHRSSLAWAAILALNGVSSAGMGFGDWATHTIEHGISAIYSNVAHGAGLGVVFPAWMKYCYDENPKRFDRWAANVWGAKSLDEGIEAMKLKLESWGSPTNLSDLGVEKSDMEKIADCAFAAGEIGVVKSLDKRDILEILKLCI